MSDYREEIIFEEEKPIEKKKKNYLLHFFLFVVTFFTTLFAGAEWTTGKFATFELTELIESGLTYSILILTVLALHEFAHYFAAKFHSVEATLPYFIPFPPISGFLNFGTMGAVIKTKSVVHSNKAMFDIGIAGPIASFVASLAILIYGFANLPPVEYLLNIHPDYFSPEYGKDSLHLEFGPTLLYYFLSKTIPSHNDFVPPMSEMYHYPYLLVGWFGLFVTAMNLMPVGQLDGGHIIYSMFGSKVHIKIASIILTILGLLGIIGFIDSAFSLNLNIGWSGWFFWGLVLYFVIKPWHPPTPFFYRLDKKRMILGYFSMAIFILSFSPAPFVISF